jgi:hypothetical protein
MTAARRSSCWTLRDCTTLASVELQLGLNDLGNGPESGEGLHAYESHRGSDPNGAADVVRALTLAGSQ